MEIVDLALQPDGIRDAAAALLVEHFEKEYGWPSLASARQELDEVVAGGFARAMLDNGRVVGWAGGLSGYNGRVWELHPVVVDREYWRRGIGRALIASVEAEAV